MSKSRVCIVFGGRSPEHEVSISTGCAIIAAIDKERFEPVPVYMCRNGCFRRILNTAELEKLAGSFLKEEDITSLSYKRAILSNEPETGLILFNEENSSVEEEPIDILFPALHGYCGEDGSIQGLARLASLPCVGSGILGSSAGMDKIVMKCLFESVGLPLLPWWSIELNDWLSDRNEVLSRFQDTSLPLFVKPANAGSSIGISKVNTPEELSSAMDEAFRYDRRIVLEKGIIARELECGILGNEKPDASIVGEIRPHREFYDYTAKYKEEGTGLDIPADITDNAAKTIREMSIKAFNSVDAAGMSRVDFLMENDTGEIYINEINTLPGFTPISMYPALWGASGVSYSGLITRLIDLSVDRAGIESSFSTGSKVF